MGSRPCDPTQQTGTGSRNNKVQHSHLTRINTSRPSTYVTSTYTHKTQPNFITHYKIFVLVFIISYIKLDVKLQKTRLMLHICYVSLVKTWNSLPLSIRNCRTLPKFKEKLEIHLLYCINNLGKLFFF